jgi:hypothetical protein
MFKRRRNRLTAMLCAASLAISALTLLQLQAVPARAGTTPDALIGTQTDTSCGNGVYAVNTTLPKGFNPLTATDAELIADNLPIRPTSAADQAIWQRYVTHVPRSTCSFTPGPPATTAAVPTPTSAAAPASSDTTTPNWAGWVADDHTYTDAYAYWNVPPVRLHAYKYEAHAVQWVGIGNGPASHPLVQAGSSETEYLDPGGHYFVFSIWWEVVPQISSSQNVSLGVNDGDLIYVHVHVVKDDAVMTVIDENDATSGRSGGTYSYKKGTFYPSSQAEWIIERPEQWLGSHYYPPLLYSTTTFTSATASGTGVSRRGAGSLPRYSVAMWTCTSPREELAYAGGIASNHTTFADYFKSSGHQDPASC